MSGVPSFDPAMGGGWVAVIFAAIIAFGGGVKWFVTWRDGLAKTRSAKLDLWQKELDLREERMDAEREADRAATKARLASLENAYNRMHREHTALWAGSQLLANALRTIDSDNSALALFDKILNQSYKIDVEVPEEMAGLIERIR